MADTINFAKETEEGLRTGDIVAIRGDLRRGLNGICAYAPGQLINGKYVMHTGHGGIWLGRVIKVKGDMALVGGGWRGVERYEVMLRATGPDKLLGEQP